MPELDVARLGPLHLGTFDKSLFSMVIPQIDAILKEHKFESVLIVGIEVSMARMPVSTLGISMCNTINGQPLSVPRLCASDRLGSPGQRI